jgi:hypothetical protein
LAKQQERPSRLGIPSAFPRSRARHREPQAGEPQARAHNATKLGLAFANPVSAIPGQNAVIAVLRDVTLITGRRIVWIRRRKATRRDGLKCIIQSKVGEAFALQSRETRYGVVRKITSDRWLIALASATRRYTCAVDGLKVLDPELPIREADIVFRTMGLTDRCSVGWPARRSLPIP